MKSEVQIVVEIEDKEHVVENKIVLPEPFELTVVRLDMKLGDESRYRLRLADGVEGRVSLSKEPHYQVLKKHLSKSIYVVHKGWIAILFKKATGYRIEVAFAKSKDRFYVEVPGAEWYAAYLSKNVVWTYSSSDTKTGETRCLEPSLPTEKDMLSMFGKQNELSSDHVEQLVRDSYLAS